jgi:hypothetical protein
VGDGNDEKLVKINLLEIGKNTIYGEKQYLKEIILLVRNIEYNDES